MILQIYSLVQTSVFVFVCLVFFGGVGVFRNMDDPHSFLADCTECGDVGKCLNVGNSTTREVGCLRRLAAGWVGIWAPMRSWMCIMVLVSS